MTDCIPGKYILSFLLYAICLIIKKNLRHSLNIFGLIDSGRPTSILAPSRLLMGSFQTEGEFRTIATAYKIKLNNIYQAAL